MRKAHLLPEGNNTTMDLDTAFEMANSNIRFGAGVTREIGMDVKDRGLGRVMVLTDPHLCELPPVQTVLDSLSAERVDFELFDQVRVEPTDKSFLDAISFAKDGRFDGYVAIGGGSTIDTAKATSLYTTYPVDFLDYVNAPIGLGNPVPGPIAPLIAIPTTAGTGSETTGVAIFDFVELSAKTGIAHRHIKPILGLVDPDNTFTVPPEVAASTGVDVLCHALESYTAMPFCQRPYPGRPTLRPSYQGSNPISDVWALEAMRLVAEFLPRVVADAADVTARANMLLASTMAGMGFGSAGVHLPHGMSYPVAGLVEKYLHPGYPVSYPIVPHGVAVIVNAPAVFKFTASACPERHLHAAEVLGANINGVGLDQSGEILSYQIMQLMRELGMPNGLEALGYGTDDIPALVKGTLPQHRVTKLSPKLVDKEDLFHLFTTALRYW